MDGEVFIRVPSSRIVLLARHLGSMDTNACPPRRTVCPKNLKDFGTGDQCEECWFHFLMKGI
jgi:hypothetical protein